jgi:uncharacterized membrane protein YheB (UPF0754 family)
MISFSGAAVSCLVNGLIGAFIGAVTNELAIRWIFWYILPAKKVRLAEAVKNAVSKELMSPEKIAERMKSEKSRAVIARNIEAWLSAKLDEDLPAAEDLLPAAGAAGAERLKKFLGRLTAAEILAAISGKTFLDNELSPLIERELSALLSKSPRELLPAETERFLTERIPDIVDKALLSEDNIDITASRIADIVHPALGSEKSLADILSPGAAATAENFVFDALVSQSDNIAAFFGEPGVRRRIAGKIREAALEWSEGRGGGGLAGLIKRKAVKYGYDLFNIDHDVQSLCAKIPAKIRESFGDRDSRGEIRKLASRVTGSLLAMRLGDIFGGVKYEDVRQSVKSSLRAFLDTDARGKIAAGVRDALEDISSRGILDAVLIIEPGFSARDAADAVSRKLVRAANSMTGRKIILARCGKLASELGKKRIGRISAAVPPAELEKIKISVAALSNAAAGAFMDIAAEKMESFVEDAGIWDIIAESIVSYDDKKLEALVRKIANRELVWVTVLGGVLGFIIGVLQGVLNVFGGLEGLF